MTQTRLTVPKSRDTVPRFLYAYRTGPLTLKSKAHDKRHSEGAFFVSTAICSMAVDLRHPSGWPVLGPVLATSCQPSPNQPLTDRDGFQTTKESAHV